MFFVVPTKGGGSRWRQGNFTGDVYFVVSGRMYLSMEDSFNAHLQSKYGFYNNRGGRREFSRGNVLVGSPVGSEVSESGNSRGNVPWEGASRLPVRVPVVPVANSRRYNNSSGDLRLPREFSGNRILPLSYVINESPLNCSRRLRSRARPWL